MSEVAFWSYKLVGVVLTLRWRLMFGRLASLKAAYKDMDPDSFENHHDDMIYAFIRYCHTLS